LQHRTHPTSSVQVIRYLRQRFPTLRIYAAIDQYRTSIRKELDYAGQKIEAGANGFFTQPFFDSRMLEIYAEALAQTTVYWGISPVLSETSRSYWESKNNTVFPRGFRTDLDTNVALAREILETARRYGGNAYIMPIRADTLSYLKAIFGTP
jgi:methylenetetrahydrofolate reductase (NADPH)